MQKNNYPKLHNATWPGIVGKGPDSEPPISLDTLLDLTVAAEVDGVKFDGIDLGLFEPHFNIDETDDGLKRLAEKVASLNFDQVFRQFNLRLLHLAGLTKVVGQLLR